MENLRRVTTKELKSRIKQRLAWLRKDPGDFGDTGAALIELDVTRMRTELFRRRRRNRHSDRNSAFLQN